METSNDWNIKYVHGNLLDMLDTFDAVLHGCNAFHTFGAGIAAQFREKHPQTYAADLQTGMGDPLKIGTYSKSVVGECDVLNCYTQYRTAGFGASLLSRKPFDYDAFRKVLKAVKAEYTGKRIGMPMIGAGLAGGDWNVISSIIISELRGEDVTVVQFQQQTK